MNAAGVLIAENRAHPHNVVAEVRDESSRRIEDGGRLQNGALTGRKEGRNEMVSYQLSTPVLATPPPVPKSYAPIFWYLMPI